MDFGKILFKLTIFLESPRARVCNMPNTPNTYYTLLKYIVLGVLLGVRQVFAPEHLTH